MPKWSVCPNKLKGNICWQIARFAIEDTGGYFVATPDDPDDYVDQFAAACRGSTCRISR